MLESGFLNFITTLWFENYQLNYNKSFEECKALIYTVTNKGDELNFSELHTAVLLHMVKYPDNLPLIIESVTEYAVTN